MPLACGVSAPCTLGCTVCKISLNRLLKVGDVQSGPLGATMFGSGAGSGVGR